MPTPITVITVTATPTDTPLPGIVQRPIVPEPAGGAPPGAGADLYRSIVESATAALSIFWVVGGALVFLVMAGLLLALAVRGQRAPGFELTPEDDAGATPERYQMEPPAPPSPGDGEDTLDDLADREWPDDLP